MISLRHRPRPSRPSFNASRRPLVAVAATLLLLVGAGCEPQPPAPGTASDAEATPHESLKALTQPVARYQEPLSSGAISIVLRPLQREPLPVVVLAHQFRAEQAQSEATLERLAEVLANRGIATYRVHYDKSPEAAATTIEYDSPLALVKDVAMVLDQLRVQDWVDKERIGVVGYDIGALLAVSGTVDTKLTPRAMVLWSPPTDFRVGFTNFLKHSPGTSNILVRFEDRPVVLLGSFFQQLDAVKPLESIKTFKGSLLGVTGAESVEGLAALRQYIGNASATSHDTIIVENSDAALGTDGKNPAAAEKVINSTADWLERAL